MKITNYNEFLLEKEFQRILEAIRLINEADTYNLGDTVEWDLTDKGTPDEPSPEMEWTFDPKSKLQKAKDKISDFTSWLKKDDADIDLKFEHPLVNLLKNFIEKVKNEIRDPEKFRAKVKEYFVRMLDEIKSLPEKIKRDLLSKAFIVLAAYIPLSNIVTPDVIEKEPITAEIKADIDSRQQQKPVKTVVAEPKKETSKQKASFEKAQSLVKSVEAGYSDDRNDTGNYIPVAGGGQRFIGTNHGISAPILAKYFKDKGITRLLTKQDMIDLKYETALEIYKKDYWDAQGLGEFKSQSIANVLYDGCVNQGAGATLTVLKNSMENLGHNAEDIGSWDEFHEKLTPTVNEMDNAETENLFEEIKEERMIKYRKADTWDDHGRGWTDRIKDIAFVDGQTDSDLA